jgi:hypothetical protein
MGLLLAACASAPPKTETKPEMHRFAFSELTVIDEGTGLVWTRNANLAAKPLFWKGDDNVYSFIQKLNRENYAGYSDWRLPKKEELQGMLNFAKGTVFDATRLETWPYWQLKKAGFSDVRDYEYWSSTRKAEDTRLIWVGNMMSGEMVPEPETNQYCVWPVRGGR